MWCRRAVPGPSTAGRLPATPVPSASRPAATPLSPVRRCCARRGFGDDRYRSSGGLVAGPGCRESLPDHLGRRGTRAGGVPDQLPEPGQAHRRQRADAAPRTARAAMRASARAQGRGPVRTIFSAWFRGWCRSPTARPYATGYYEPEIAGLAHARGRATKCRIYGRPADLVDVDLRRDLLEDAEGQVDPRPRRWAKQFRTLSRSHRDRGRARADGAGS